MQVEVNKQDVERLKADLLRLHSDQMPYAMALALTRTAQGAQGAIKGDMGRVYDRPKPYTVNSIRLQSATKSRQQSRVYVADQANTGRPAISWLSATIAGGDRNYKGFEILLQARGILPRGYYAVPGKGAKLDRYGNIAKSQLNAIFRQNPNAKRQRYIVIEKTATQAGGIYEVNPTTHGIWPIMHFTKKPTYATRLAFHDIATRVYQADFNRNFQQAWNQAIGR